MAPSEQNPLSRAQDRQERLLERICRLKVREKQANGQGKRFLSDVQ